MYSLTAFKNCLIFSPIFLLLLCYSKVNPLSEQKAKLDISVSDKKVLNTINVGGISLCLYLRERRLRYVLFLVSYSMMLIYNNDVPTVFFNRPSELITDNLV